MPTIRPDGASVAPAVTRERIVWVDAARALAVLGVVLFHIGFLHYQPRLADASPAVGGLWNHVDALLGSFRMPMLLLLSGMLASGKVRRGLGRGKALESAASNYYLYAVWLGVYLLVIRDATFPLRVHGPLDLVKQLVLPYTTLWFIQCLAVGVFLLAALHRWRPLWILLGLLVVHLGVEGFLHGDVPMPIRTLPYYLYLALGAHLAPQVRRLAHSGRATVLAGVGFVGGWGVSQLLEGRSQPLHAAAHLVTCLFAAVLLMGLTRLICRWQRLGQGLARIGRRTLAIYVMHVPMVAAVRQLPDGYHDALRRAFAASPILALAYPLVLMVLMAALCLALESGLRRAGATFLFSMPEPLRRHVRRPDGDRPGGRGVGREPARAGGYAPRHAR